MFRLTKWYLDVVGADGAAFIGYHARLDWRRLHLDYAAQLIAPATSAVEEQWTVRSPAPPRVRDGACRWRCAALQLRGEWCARAAGFRRTLYRDDGRIVDWHCVAPWTSARVRSGAHHLHGAGYIERLRLSIPPWRLPLDVLLWGRFHSHHHALTWLEWRGAAPLQLAWVDGTLYERARIDDDVIEVRDAGVRLTLCGGRTLRDAPIAGTLTAAAPVLRPLLPERFFRAHEHKRLGRAIITQGEHSEEGWAIHEVVTWR